MLEPQTQLKTTLQKYFPTKMTECRRSINSTASPVLRQYGHSPVGHKLVEHRRERAATRAGSSAQQLFRFRAPPLSSCFRYYGLLHEIKPWGKQCLCSGLLTFTQAHAPLSTT